MPIQYLVSQLPFTDLIYLKDRINDKTICVYFPPGKESEMFSFLGSSIPLPIALAHKRSFMSTIAVILLLI